MQAGNEDQDADERHENPEHEGEHARAHMHERAEIVGGRVQGDAGAEQHHQEPGIEIFLLEQVLHAYTFQFHVYRHRPPTVQATLG
jgi:hypothetical protein